MAKILSYTIFGFAMVTLCIAYRIAKNGIRKDRIAKLCFLASIASSWWSFFFGLMINQTDTNRAAWLRGFGNLGMFALLICCSYILSAWSKIQGTGKLWIESVCWTGILIYPFTVLKTNIHFELTSYGMSYQMKTGLWSYAYNLYCVVIAVNLAYALVYMLRHSKHKREKIIAYDLIMSVFITFFGCVLDTVMPTFGIPAFPGSTIGQFVGMLVMYQTYQFYQKLRMTPENMSQYIYYSVDEPVLLFDENEKLCMENNGALAFLEQTESNATRDIYEVFELERNVFKFRGDKSRIEAKCRLNDRICILSIDKIYDSYKEITGYIVIVHDITERVQNMQQLELEKERADKANAAKGNFLANMSHEIRTPINAVMGMNEMILRECEDEEILDYAQNIHNASVTLLALINDILDFSKIESGRMELVTEAYSLKNMLQLLESECQLRAEKKGLRLQFEVPEDLPGVLLGDEVRIRQILLNILTNAIKYTETGSVSLTVSCMRQEDNVCDFTYTVRDTGIGIKEENLSRLFEMFDRGDEEKVHNIEGTGLGLSIVERLVKLMHGTIMVESEYGKGSVFTVRIQQKAMGSQLVGKLHEDRSARRQRRKYTPSFVAKDARVLVVDDNRVNLTVIRGLLRETQMEIECVESGVECLEAVQREKYHIILLDHMMPGLDGVETLQRLKELKENKSKDAMVIALTANAMSGMREMFLEKGFDDYISKPVDPIALEQAMIRFLPKEILVRPIN